MPETGHREKRLGAIALASGIGLALLAGFGGVVAALAAVLAQVALALGTSWRRGTRLLLLQAGARAWVAELRPLLLAWAGAFCLAAALLAWPLSALLRDASLNAALGTSLVAGIVLVALWRSWPLWQGLESESATWASHRARLGAPEAGHWRGLRVAVPAALALAGGIVLAWPGMPGDTLRWPLAAAYAALLPLLHRGMQAATTSALPVLELRTPAKRARQDEAEAAAPLDSTDWEAHLYEAARAGRVERALELLEAGADPHALPAPGDRDQRSLVALAAVLPDLRLLRALIAKGADINQSRGGMTPLLAATRDSWHGRPDAVTTLLANGADPRVADGEGNTPLHHAARSSDPGVAALLRDAAADIDALNQDGLTPLGVACVAGNWRLARFLLERGAQPEPAGGLPVLLAAAFTEEDDPAGVQLLLKHKARVTVRDARGRTALHEAALAGHVEIVELLLAAGADVQAGDNEGRTPWLEAAFGGSLPVLERLAAAAADVQAADAQGRNALMYACSGSLVTEAVVRRLLEWGVAVDRADFEGRRAVDMAAAAGRWSIIRLLDPDYALPSAVAHAGEDDVPGTVPDRLPLEVLREALHEGRLEGHGALLKLLSAEELGRLLHDAGLPPSALGWLLAHGADGSARNAHGDVPMFTWLARGAAAVPSLRVLLDNGLSPAGAGGLARFLSACLPDGALADAAEQCALELLERGADPFGAVPQGDGPLALAVRLQAQRLLDALLRAGVDRETRDRHGMSPLHLAAALGRIEAIKRLVMHGASPQARAADGQTPLGVALASGRRDLVDWLDWRGWPLPGRELLPADVPAAAVAGDIEALRRLFELGFAVDAVDAQGCTALLRAAGGGHRAVVEMLLERGANPQRAANTGATPLSAAVSMRHVDIVEVLLQAHAQMEHRLPGGVTVLMLAAARGLPDIVARLLTAGADIHAGDAQGLTPLHCAALYGFAATDGPRLVALLDVLLLAGAEPDGVAAGSVTPLLLLLGARAEPGSAGDEDVVLAGLERLLEEQVSLDVQDPRGFGPLHLAALHGLMDVLLRLLRAGANPDVRDSLNRRPRDIAMMRGFVDIAAELDAIAMPADGMPMAPPHTAAPPTIARFLRDPPSPPRG